MPVTDYFVPDSPDVDFLIVTALQDEFDELVSLLHAPPSYNEPPDAISYVPRIDSKGAYKVAIIQTGQTNAIAQAAVTDAIKRRNPRAVILTGIAAGFPEAGVSLGDILIPFLIAPYEHAKITGPGPESAKVKYQHRGPLLYVADSLWDAAALLKNDPNCPWEKDLRTPRPISPRQSPKIHADQKFTIGSGDKLVASELAEARQWLLEKFPGDAVGLEMESYGVSIACRKAEKPFLLVKASQDHGTAAKDAAATKDEWRRYAAAVAAKFVLTLVERYTFAGSSSSNVASTPIWTQEELKLWKETLSAEQEAVQDNECAWLFRFPPPGRSPLDVEFIYDATNDRFQRYDRLVESNPLLQSALQDWQHANPEDWRELNEEPWGQQVRLERVRVKRTHEAHKDAIWLAPSKYLYYIAIQQRLDEPNLRWLRHHVFGNATKLREPLLLPSNFAIHMGVISKDQFLLLRKRQPNGRTPYSGAWEAGIGEFMHGPHSPSTSDFVDANQPSLEAFLLRAVFEELNHEGARIEDFTVHGFALERLTLAPKLLVLYRSEATIDRLMDGALHCDDYAYDVDNVPLNATAIARVACEPYYRTWGPTSKLTMMLALTACLDLSESRTEIRKVKDLVRSLRPAGRMR